MLESACRIHTQTEIEIRVSGLSEVTLPKDKYLEYVTDFSMLPVEAT
jgi:hypothetical protein